MGNGLFYVILFESVNHAMWAEKLLKKKNIPGKLIPVPRHISSNCGVCIRFLKEERESVENALKGKVENILIRHLN